MVFLLGLLPKSILLVSTLLFCNVSLQSQKRVSRINYKITIITYQHKWSSFNNSSKFLHSSFFMLSIGNAAHRHHKNKTLKMSKQFDQEKIAGKIFQNCSAHFQPVNNYLKFIMGSIIQSFLVVSQIKSNPSLAKQTFYFIFTLVLFTA